MHGNSFFFKWHTPLGNKLPFSFFASVKLLPSYFIDLRSNFPKCNDSHSAAGAVEDARQYGHKCLQLCVAAIGWGRWHPRGRGCQPGIIKCKQWALQVAAGGKKSKAWRGLFNERTQSGSRRKENIWAKDCLMNSPGLIFVLPSF